MSTEQQALDQRLIDQTKQQIRALVAEIAKLSKSNATPQEFYSEFLNKVVQALAAIGGVVWTLNEENRLALQYQLNLKETNLAHSEEEQARHGRLLYQAMTRGEGVLVPPHSGFGDDGQAANTTDFLLVLHPLRTDLETVGVVEVFQRPEAGPQTQTGYLRFLSQMCDLAAEYLKSHQLRHFADRQNLWTRLEDFTRTIHASLDPRETAYTIANEGRRLIDCDRVSVAIRRGRKCVIEAISGQDMFDKRSNTVRLLGKLASAVVATGEPIWYTGDTTDFAPQVEDAVQAYVDEAHSKTVAILPLIRPRHQNETEKEEDDAPAEEPLGALIVEQIEDSRVPDSMVHRVDVVASHSSSALGNALEHTNLFLMPVWRTLGKATWVLRARTLPWTISIAAAVIALVTFVCVFPADFEMKADGTAEPKFRRDVFAGVDGVVQEIAVGHDSSVRRGDLLLRMRNEDLDQKITALQGERATAAEKLRSTDYLLKQNRDLLPAERNRLEGEMLEYAEEVRNKTAQLKLEQDKQKSLTVTSPTDGIVTTWDVRNLLIERPVQRGQKLLTVANPDGEWELEILMPEKKVGHIVDFYNKVHDRYVEEIAAALSISAEEAEKLATEQTPEEISALVGRTLTDRLPVTYILATEPGESRHGEVVGIQKRAEVKGEEGSTVLIKVAIDESELPLLRPGAQVTAKIYCGRKSIGYVWLYEAIGFLQSRVFFPLF